MNSRTYILAVLTYLLVPFAGAQDLASQLYGSIPAPHRAFFDLFRQGEAFVLEGSQNSDALFFAELPDADMAYSAGEQIVWDLTSGQGGRLFLFDVGASGAVRQLIPNAFADPIGLSAGEKRRVPLSEDGVTVYMSDQSDVQLWLAILVPGDVDFDLEKVGDPRLGEVRGGAPGLVQAIEALGEAGTPFSFALSVFGKDTPPLAVEDVERALSLSREQSTLVQQRLNDLGFNVGVADGLFGRNTRSGLRDWQASQDLDQSGYLNTYTLRRLLSF